MAVMVRTLVRDGSPTVTANHPTDVPCPLPRRIAWVRVSIASPNVRPSPNDRRVGIRIRTFEMLGLHFVTAHRIAFPAVSFACVLPEIGISNSS